MFIDQDYLMRSTAKKELVNPDSEFLGSRETQLTTRDIEYWFPVDVTQTYTVEYCNSNVFRFPVIKIQQKEQ